MPTLYYHADVPQVVKRLRDGSVSLAAVTKHFAKCTARKLSALVSSAPKKYILTCNPEVQGMQGQYVGFLAPGGQSNSATAP